MRYWVYQSLIGSKNSVLHEEICPYCSGGKAAIGMIDGEPVAKWSGSFPTITDAQKSIEMLPNAHIKMCRACQPDLTEDEKTQYTGWLDTSLDGIRSKFPDAKLRDGVLFFSETSFHELKEAFPDLTEKMLAQHSLFDNVRFESALKAQGDKNLKALFQPLNQKLIDEGENFSVSSKKRKNKKKTVTNESLQAGASTERIEAKELLDTIPAALDVDSEPSAAFEEATLPEDMELPDLEPDITEEADDTAQKKGHDDTYYENYIREYGIAPDELTEEGEEAGNTDAPEGFDALDESPDNPGLTSMLSKKFSQAFGAPKEAENEVLPEESKKSAEVRINSDLEKIKTRMKNTKIDSQSYRGMSTTIAELQEKFRRQEREAAGEIFEEDEDGDALASEAGSDFDEGIRYKHSVYSSEDKGAREEEVSSPSKVMDSASGLSEQSANFDVRKKYAATPRKKIGFSQIKAAFPAARLEGGRLYIPGADFDDFKQKFPDVTMADLRTSFAGVRFGRENITKTIDGGISGQTRSLILLAGGILIFILLIFGVRALLNNDKGDETAQSNGEVSENVENAAEDAAADARLEGIKAAFPNTVAENGKIYLPDVTLAQFIEKFPEYADEAAVKAAFPNIRFKIDEVNFEAIKELFPDAQKEGEKVILPSVSFTQFKKYFPQFATLEDVAEVFPEIEFKQAAVTLEEMQEAFPNVKMENDKLVLPDVTFDEFKEKFSQYADVNAMKEDYPEIQFKAPALSFESIKAAFPEATLQDGKLAIPDATFDEFQANFPQYSTVELLKVDFPEVTFKSQ